jgi:hypothetical protein
LWDTDQGATAGKARDSDGHERPDWENRDASCPGHDGGSYDLDGSGRRPGTGLRLVSLIVGVPATLAAAFLVFSLWVLSSLPPSASDASSALIELIPAAGVLFVAFNLAIAQVAPAWVIVVYAFAAATAVNLPFLSPMVHHGGEGFLVWSWVSGIVGLLGTAFGVRPLRRPEPKQDEGCPGPAPPMNTGE